MPEPNLDWAEARRALAAEVGRVCALLRTRPDASVPALGSWDLGEVAMHLSQAFLFVTALARGERERTGDGAEQVTGDEVPGLERRPSGSLIADIGELGDVTTRSVRADAERDPLVLADRIEERAAAFLAEAETMSRAERRSWIVDGVTVAVPTLTGHLLNETTVHGRDLALAAGRPWPIDRATAAMVVDGFLVPVLAALDPRAMVDQTRAAGVRAIYDVRVRGGARHRLAFDDGALRIGPAAPGQRVDCHLSVDPAAFLLVAWGRISQWRAIARGQLLAWGPKPWLGPRLRAYIRYV